MTHRKAERGKKKPQKSGEGGCAHQRVVDYHADSNGTRTGHLVCRECRAVIPDPLKSLHPEEADSSGTKRVNGTSPSRPGTVCSHQRVVSYVHDAHGKRTGLLVCRECRAVFPDPFLALG